MLVMEVYLNNEIREFSDNLTISGVLEELGYEKQAVRVERNGERVPASRFAEVTVNDGDRVEIKPD